jgi:hypothetical protein
MLCGSYGLIKLEIPNILLRNPDARNSECPAMQKKIPAAFILNSANGFQLAARAVA